MVTSPNSHNAQTFAENDALPLLENLESELSRLSTSASDARFQKLDGLLNQFVSQANQAGIAVLAAIATRLRAVLQQFHQHQQTIPIDSLIQQLLLQAHECLQLPVTELSMFGEFDAQQARAKAEPIVQQLEMRLMQVNSSFGSMSPALNSGSSDGLDDLLGDDIGFDGLDDFADSDNVLAAAADLGSVGDLIDDLFSTEDDEEVADGTDWLLADDVLTNTSRSRLSDLELATLEEPGLDIDKLFNAGFTAEEEDESDSLFDAFSAPDAEPESTQLPVDPLHPGAIAKADLLNELFDGDVPTERDVVTPSTLFEWEEVESSAKSALNLAHDAASGEQASGEVDDEMLLGELFADDQPLTATDNGLAIAPPQHFPVQNVTPPDPVAANDVGTVDGSEEDSIFSDFIVPELPTKHEIAPDADMDSASHLDNNESLDAGDDLFGGLGWTPPADPSPDLSPGLSPETANQSMSLAELIEEQSDLQPPTMADPASTDAGVPDADNEALLAALFADDGAIAEDGVTAEPTSTVLSPRSAPQSVSRIVSAGSTWQSATSEPQVADATEGLVASFWHSPESIADQGLIHLNRDRVEALNQQIVQLTVNQSWLHHQHQLLQHTIAELQLRTDSATDAAASTPSQAMLVAATAQLQQMEQTLMRQQETVSSLRDQWIDAQTLPLYQFLQRFPTWLSQSVLTQHKPVQISIQAMSARLDRATLETLQDAIAQLLQYSLEYSLEPQDIRQRRGKPEVAQMALTVQVQGRQIIFELTDDGWGLDLDAIRQDAAELGWGDEQTLANLSLSELIQQGAGKLRSLTTATRQVSTLSLVQTRLQDQQGRLSATTTPGQGLTFTIQLPLPLIKLDGLLCQVNEQFLAFSAAAIEEIVVPTANQLDAAGQRLVWNGQSIPVMALTDYLADICASDLAQQLDLPPVSLPETWHAPLLIVQTATHPVAIAVDTFVAQEALVIQALSPESAAEQPNYIQGCAALRSGQQVVMLDAVLLAEQFSKTAIAV